MFLITAYGCTAGEKEYDLINIFSLPAEAYDVKKLLLGTKDNQQLFFRLHKLYPSKELLKIYGDILSNDGWVKCVGKIEDWQFYQDLSSEAYPYTHELANYWAKDGEQKIALLTLRYYSKLLLDENTPDNDVQNIALLVQRNINLDNESSNLSINCE